MNSSAELKILWDKIKDIKVAMLTTLDKNGHLRSRPMYTQQAEFDNNIWFFTKLTSPKVDELDENTQVNLSYLNPDDHVYVSVSGTAQIIRNKSKAQQLWNDNLKAWFSQGLDDPDLALIKINAEFAEYWDTTTGKMVTLFGILTTIFSGEEHSAGEHRKLNF